MKFNKRVSKQPRKQRKALYDAPLHARAKQLHCNLNKELRSKEKKRSVRLKKGDKVRVTRGKFKKKTGAVTKIDLKLRRVFVEGIIMKKQSGKEIPAPLHASNLEVTSMADRDKKKAAGVKVKQENKKEEAVKAAKQE